MRNPPAHFSRSAGMSHYRRRRRRRRSCLPPQPLLAFPGCVCFCSAQQHCHKRPRLIGQPGSARCSQWKKTKAGAGQGREVFQNKRVRRKQNGSKGGGGWEGACDVIRTGRNLAKNHCIRGGGGGRTGQRNCCNRPGGSNQHILHYGRVGRG